MQEQGVIRGPEDAGDTTRWRRLFITHRFEPPGRRRTRADTQEIETKGGKRPHAQCASDRHRDREPSQDEGGEQKRFKEYRGLLLLTRQMLNDTKRVLQETEAQRRPGMRVLREGLTNMANRVRLVAKQAKRSAM